MILNHFPEIQTERLSLRKLKESDWNVVSYLRSDKTVNTFVKRPNANSKEKALAFIIKINDDIDNKKLYYWSITKTTSDTMIGSICLWNFSEDQKSAEVGYDLSPEFQKLGIMNEALMAIIGFGFNNLHLKLIEAYTHKENESSKRLLERNEFVLHPTKKDKHNHNNVIYQLSKA